MQFSRKARKGRQDLQGVSQKAPAGVSERIDRAHPVQWNDPARRCALGILGVRIPAKSPPLASE
jgi:hypothetical protein